MGARSLRRLRPQEIESQEQRLIECSGEQILHYAQTRFLYQSLRDRSLETVTHNYQPNVLPTRSEISSQERLTASSWARDNSLECASSLRAKMVRSILVVNH